MIDHEFEELVRSVQQIREMIRDHDLRQNVRDDLEAQMHDELRDISEKYGMTEQEVLEL